MMRTKASLAVITAIGLTATLASCSADADPVSDASSITVWTLEQQSDRFAKARAAADDFTEQTGIEVELVGVNEDQFPQLITAAAAAGELPDVVGALPLAAVRTMSGNDLVNTEATTEVVEALGVDTFSPAALELTQEDGAQIAVPSDGFALSVIYRTDLFEQAGLPAPESYEDLLNAAMALDSPEVAGFVAGNSPSTAYTQQVFEFMAIANGCELVDDAGEITIDSSECVEAFDFYGNLVENYTVPGAMDSTATKTTYMAGQAAITVWASFILDEMGGLVNDAMPTCPQCADDPQFIAKNSAFITSFEGPSGSEPVSYGDVTSWVISSDAAADPSAQFVDYFMNDAYLQWLSQAPEGKFPTRLGTPEEPQKYADAWQELEAGVDTQAQLSEIYSTETLADLQGAVYDFSRWGFNQGQGDLLGAVLTELPIPEAIAAMANGEIDGQGAADQVSSAVESIQDSLQ